MILKNENPTIAFGLFTIFLFVVVFGIWIGLAPLNSAVVAPGKVGIINNKKTIQHLEGGVVEKIFVKDGDRVKAADALIELKNANLISEISIVKNEILQNSALLSRLEAQRDEKEDIKFKEEIYKFEGYDLAIQSQIDIFNEQNRLFSDERNITTQKINQLQNQIQGINAILNAKKERMTSIDEEIAEWDKLFKAQLADKIKLRDLKRERINIKGDMAANSAEIARLNVQIMQAKSEIILKERIKKDEILKNIEDVKKKLVSAIQKYEALNDQLDRTIIKSPIDGVVVESLFYTIGGVIKPGEKVMSIVPDNASYVIDAKLGISDIDNVGVGFDADIRFNAFHSSQSKVVQGKIIYISADSLVDKRDFSYYEIKAEITAEGLRSMQENNFFLLPGMPVEVVVKTGERTILSYMIKPFSEMFVKAFNEE
ncbi:HlyD family type I secretion periplasmic adaptor subunit [Campylobacter sp.]|uniref:HlyD family type I secretion periplasmic adaptor subunit n=1 Tax=Campylobacter sp. TaxID=205 RepID=UPI0026FBC9FD|nr:HlyD family type I secretion periplasmic adaptor subunit [Campylobacter sp.]